LPREIDVTYGSPVELDPVGSVLNSRFSLLMNCPEALVGLLVRLICTPPAMSVMVIVAQGEGPMGVPPVQTVLKLNTIDADACARATRLTRLANSQRFMTLLIFYYLLYRLTIR
jgi:hypothetical protein